MRERPLAVYRTLALVALVVAALPARVDAHVRLTRSSPAAGDTLRTAPASIQLWFSGRAELAFTRVQLLGPDGAPVAVGQASRLASSMAAFTVPIGTTLAAGTYTVVWQTAAADGHPVRGRYAFTVVAAATAAPDGAIDGDPTPPGRDSGRSPPAERVATIPDEDRDEVKDYQVARWAEFIAILAVLGTIVLRYIVLAVLDRGGEPTAEIRERARQIGIGAVILLVTTGVYRLFTELRALSAPGATVDLTDLQLLLTGTSWGTGWLVGGIGAAVVFTGLVVARRVGAGWLLAGAGALAVAASPALTGHAAADERWPVVAVVADTLHVLGAGAWLGTLLLVVTAGLPAAARRPVGESGPAVAVLLRAFHPVALVCVPLVVVSGLVSSWLRVGSWSALTSTPYGTFLLVKIALFACVALTGAYNWRRVLPRLGGDASGRHIGRSASLELAIAAVVVAITAALVVTTPPR